MYLHRSAPVFLTFIQHMQRLAGLYLPILAETAGAIFIFSLFSLSNEAEQRLYVRSRPHQKQDYIWLTIWAKIFSTGKLLPSYNHKVCMINHMDVDRENVIIAHDHAPLGVFA